MSIDPNLRRPTGKGSWGCLAVVGIILAVGVAVELVSKVLGGSTEARIVVWIVVIGSIVGFFVWRSKQ